MAVNILCVGDVVGRPGRSLLARILPKLRRQRQIDLVVANVENASGGSGLTVSAYHKMLTYGVNLMTLGDHAFRKREILSTLVESDRIVRPANLALEAAGKGGLVWAMPSGIKVGLVCVLGRMYMKPADCPFHAVDRIMKSFPDDCRIRLIDVHAEATSEKIAMGWYLDGRVSAVVGTHTHVATADERILPDGTAYITDMGMTGPYESVLGRRIESVLQASTTSMPTPFKIATGDPRLAGVFLTVDETTGRATAIERISIADDLPVDTPYDADDGQKDRQML